MGGYRTRDTVVPALVDKCLGSTRAGTKAKAIELMLKYIEVENNGEGVVVSIDTSTITSSSLTSCVQCA